MLSSAPIVQSVEEAEVSCAQTVSNIAEAEVYRYRVVRRLLQVQPNDHRSTRSDDDSVV
jgi:hypothetical protein